MIKGGYTSGPRPENVSPPVPAAWQRPSECKDTNPKDAVGTSKVPFSTIPSEVIAELGLVMLEGARKYGRHNYRSAGVRASVYFDAAMRHLTRFWEGEDLDPDSGMPHLIHAMACCAVLRDSQVIANWTDDRPPALPEGWMATLNDRAAAIVEKYPNPVAASTALGADEYSPDCERPVTVSALNEEWMREYRWQSTRLGGLTYAYLDAKWRYLSNVDGTWKHSQENDCPGYNGPFARLEGASPD